MRIKAYKAQEYLYRIEQNTPMTNQPTKINCFVLFVQEDGRKDLDFTEQLWTVLACTHTMLEVCNIEEPAQSPNSQGTHKWLGFHSL